MVTLQIDGREEKKYQIALKKSLAKHGIGVKVRNYEVADYFVGNILGIEHKALSDFKGSLRGGRLFKQAYELSQNFVLPIILVDGNIEQLMFKSFGRYGSRWNPASLMAAVCSLYSRYKTPVFFCGKNNLAWTITNLVLKATDGKAPVYEPVREKASTSDLQMRFIGSLPGLGRTRAQEILKEYETPMRALKSVKRWNKDVKGIGRKTTSKIQTVLNSTVD